MNNLYIVQREFVVACVITVASAVVIFGSGYLLGRRHGLHKTLRQLQPPSLSDMLYARINLSDRRGIACVSRQHLGQALADVVMPPVELQEAPEAEEEQEETVLNTLDRQNPDGLLYQAILAGYGTWEGASRYVQALSKRGIAASIRERSGKHRGRTRTWYQVVTEPASKERTQEIVSILQKVDRLYDVILESLDNHQEGPLMTGVTKASL